MNIKQKLSRKMKKSGGFTLIEMLIVVAIIAILVVISIPLVSSALDKAKTATDDANERAAKAAALISYMTADSPITAETTYYYNAATGKAVNDPDGIEAYGQGSKKDGTGDAREGYVVVTVTVGGDATIAWSGSDSGGSGSGGSGSGESGSGESGGSGSGGSTPGV